MTPDALSVPCPFCGAEADKECQWLDWYTRANFTPMTWLHPQRIEAALLHAAASPPASGETVMSDDALHDYLKDDGRF